MPNTDRLINHQDGLDIVGQLNSIATHLMGNGNGSIAPIETSPTTNAHLQGDLIYFGNVLYKVIADIAAGTTLVENTNVERTSIDSEIKSVTGDVTGVKGSAETDYRKGNVNITAANVGAIPSTEKGAASGVAELDANGKVPSSQLPSYVDDVKEGYYNTLDGKFYEEDTFETEITPETDKVYVDRATNKTYRWSGSEFVTIGSDLALGETSSTAYRGDRGKTAYDHASDAGKISAATASGFYKVGATAEGHVSNLTAVAKADITALGIPDADDLGTAAAKDSTSTVAQGSEDLITSGAVYTYVDTVITQALTGSY